MNPRVIHLVYTQALIIKRKIRANHFFPHVFVLSEAINNLQLSVL